MCITRRVHARFVKSRITRALYALKYGIYIYIYIYILKAKKLKFNRLLTAPSNNWNFTVIFLKHDRFTVL